MSGKLQEALKNVNVKNFQDEHSLIDSIRNYFNDNDIEYETFSYEDVKPFL